MRCLVTGAAGFVGSHLAEALADAGHDVTGVDAFTPYYPRAAKDANLVRLRDASHVRLVEADLVTTDLAPLLDGVEAVFHCAAQPGVRASWGERFAEYETANVLATQRLLEALVGAPGLRRFVYSSSSSVYGDAAARPTREDAVPRPHSPYGVTKLAAEHLCGLYARNFGVPTVSLRYFTVYGPRQRPDMAFHRFCRAALAGDAVTVHGDGHQTRDFTFVADAVAANLAAGDPEREVDPGTVVNVGGGAITSVRDVLAILGDQLGLGGPVPATYGPTVDGDVRHTSADITRARDLLGWSPRTGLADGLAAELAWVRATVDREA